jgi:hypothetical protein
VLISDNKRITSHVTESANELKQIH